MTSVGARTSFICRGSVNLNDALRDGMSVDGAIGVAIVDCDTGSTVGKQGGNSLLDLDIAGAALAEVVQAKMRAIETLQLDDAIEDILVTLGSQYHIVMPLESRPDSVSAVPDRRDKLFLYLVLDRAQANLALARRHLRHIEQAVRI
ncbi:hypothetical protein ACQPXH_00215 [Nocardia sp. CA-135953]|uniref:hypothetical protein n=1 Tax=Nocardia sp. CA-135953 TaxID=3239978 RepID=UPI003D97D888